MISHLQGPVDEFKISPYVFTAVGLALALAIVAAMSCYFSLSPLTMNQKHYLVFRGHAYLLKPAEKLVKQILAILGLVFGAYKYMQSEKLEKRKHDMEQLKSNFICQKYLLQNFPTSEKVKENTDGKFEDIFNILVAKWNNFSTEEQKLYLEKYQQDKKVSLQVVGQEEQVQKTMMELLRQYLQFREGMEIENREKKEEKDPLKPKRPIPAFFLFLVERHAALLEENKNALDVIKISEIARMEWMSMTDEQRTPYIQVERKQEEYLHQMKLYEWKKVEVGKNNSDPSKPPTAEK